MRRLVRDVSVRPRTSDGDAYPIEREYLEYACSNERGVPVAGRARELGALRALGYRDPSLGRIYEGHLNGGQLVGLFGTPEQRAQAARDIAAGRLFAVWNTQDEPGVTLGCERGRYTLHGSKTWASGAGAVSRPIVTARRPDGSVQMCLVPLERVAMSIDAAAWRPLGMHASRSYRVTFDGARLDAADLIGGQNDYERQPWFYGGALRFSAVQTGIGERLFSETAEYLFRQQRHEDPYQLARVAEMRIACETASCWLDAGREAWEAFDREPTAEHGADVIERVDMARTVVERAARDILTLATRSVGARALVEPLPFAGLVRDLEMYLRQPAPDAALVRVAVAVFRRLSCERNAASAASTGIGA